MKKRPVIHWDCPTYIMKTTRREFLMGLGAMVSHPPSLAANILPPSQGWVWEALRPAWASCIAGVAPLLTMASTTGPMAAMALVPQAEVPGGYAAVGRDRRCFQHDQSRSAHGAGSVMDGVSAGATPVFSF